LGNIGGVVRKTYDAVFVLVLKKLRPARGRDAHHKESGGKQRKYEWSHESSPIIFLCLLATPVLF
jgi:hypothetical protein